MFLLGRLVLGGSGFCLGFFFGFFLVYWWLGVFLGWCFLWFWWIGSGGFRWFISGFVCVMAVFGWGWGFLVFFVFFRFGGGLRVSLVGWGGLGFLGCSFGVGAFGGGGGGGVTVRK